MKKILSFVALIAVFAVSCSSNSPKAAAEKFLNSFFHMEYKEAKEVSTEETKKVLDMIEQFSTMMPDSSKQSAKKIKIEIKDVKEEGDKATVTYTTSESTQEQKLTMVKQNGKWLANYSKQDGGMGAEGDASNEPMTEEPMTDSTAAPATEGTPASPDTATHQ